MTKRGTVLPSIQAAGRGIVIEIKGDGESAKKALEMVQQKLNETEQAATRFGRSAGQYGAALDHGIPKMAAASAALRALEGNFTNNIRAGERFLTMIPGIGEALGAAFPYIGAIVLTTALVKLGIEGYHAYQNIVLLKGAIEGLNSLEITVGKKVAQAADQAEESMERVLEATQGKAAALKQKMTYQSGKGIDLSDYFYSKEYKDLPTNVKADYESTYKAVAPADIPDRLAKITTEIKKLNQEMASGGKGGPLAGFGSVVGAYGPSTMQDLGSYYKARIKAATQIKELLEAENKARTGKLQALGVEGKDSPDKRGISDNPIAQAGVALAQEQAKAAADATRASGQAQLAELETQHKLLLVSDQVYYKEKFDVANKEAAAELARIDADTKKLQEAQTRQHDDKLLKRDKSGNSAEELKTQTELVKLQEKRAELTAKQLEAESRYNGEVGTMNNAAEIAGLRAAAALERERNSGIEAQIKLIQREHEIEAQKSTLAGGSDGDAKAIRDSGALAVQKLQLQQIEQGITRVEDDHRRAVEGTNDAVEKGDLSKRSAAQQTKAANAQELQDLRTLAEQYRQLAEAIGDPDLLQKAKDLDAQLATLGRTDRRGTFGKEVQDGLQGITTSIIDSAARGKQSFADMARSILDDLDKLALKMAEEKFILPLFEAAFGGGAAGGKGGGAPTGNGGGFGAAFGLPSVALDPGIGGGGGPSVYKPDAKSGGGGFLSGALGLVGKIASAAAGSGGKNPKVTSNIINNTSQPVTAGEPQVTWDSEGQSYIIETVLQNHLTGGVLSQL